MPILNLPMSTLEFSVVDNVKRVMCLVRKKWIVLTPEEWVRQHFISYLNLELGYPLSLMKVEKQILVNGLKKRFDIVLYNSLGKMKVLVECKAPAISLSPAVFDQAARYNISLKVPILIITNGMNHFCASVDLSKKSHSYLKNIPSYNEVNT